MKKKILLIILLAILGSIKVNAFTVAQIHVSVSNSQTGLSIASHPVIITDSAGFNHTYYTNAYGQFNDSVYNASSTPVKYYIITYDCNNVMHYDTVTTFGWVYKSAIFNICHVGADLGIIEIINPGDTSFNTGVQINPLVKVKNFSSVLVSTIHLGYSINGQTPIIQSFFGYNLLPGDTLNINLSAFILPASNFTFCAFILNTDNNPSNDTLCKTVIVSNPYHDAGVVDIVIPSNPIHVGDTIYPRIILKNYGLNTLTNIEVKVKINQQNPFTYTWTGNLPYNGIDTLFMGNINVIYIPDMNFKAFTNLNNDQNHNNDTSYKSFTILPPLNDVGLVQVTHPVTALTGDTIYPQIKIKNFGSSPVSSVSVRYRVDGQQIGNAICNLNIAPDSSVVFTFPQYFVCPSTSFFLIAYIHATNIFLINDSASIYLTPNPAIKDAGIIEIINPADVVCTGNTIYPKVIIKNFGQTPLSSIPIAYQRGSMTPVTAIWTGSPLNYGDTVSYTFVTPFTVPSGSSFVISAYTNLANDTYLLNNKITKSVTIANSSTLPFNITGDDTIVAGQTGVVYHAGNYSYPYCQYVWTLPPGAFLDSVYNNNIIVHFANNAQSGNITCKIITPCGVTPTSVFPIYVFTTPPPPIISLGTNHIMYSGYSTGNQWYFENNAIQGANSQTYTATQTGHYYCKVSINGSTSAQSNTIYVGFTGLDEAYVKTDFEVYPNPANDKLFFRYTIDKTDVVELKLMDIEGRCIKSILNDEQTAGEYKLETDINDLNKGMYFYQFRYGESVLSGKLIVVK